MSITEGLKPEAFWKHFYNITRIPRESGNEAAVREYVKAFAEEKGLEYYIDSIKNIIVRRPASPGCENKKAVVLQGHLDMVCEKNRDKVHNFDKDPIPVVIEGDWLKADGTTLGADNGVAIAAGLAVLEYEGPLGMIEVLLTVDEETGLTGALNLDPSIVKSRIMINLDSEEDGYIYIGCAGGKNTEGWIPVSFEEVDADDYTAFHIELKGLKGGHSGCEIHMGLANSLQLGGRFLWNAGERFETRLTAVEGGGKHNAIPREFFADILVKNSDVDAFIEYSEHYRQIITAEFKYIEKDLQFSVEKISSNLKTVYKKSDEKKILNMVYTMPNGVISMSPVINGLVETSTNLARIELKENEFYVLTCQRSSSDTECDDIADRIKACILQAGGRAAFSHEYPGWEPDRNSVILKTSEKVFKDLYSKEPVITAIHAGLECGVIGKKFEKLDMISIGPELADVHTPGEKMKISTVSKLWDFLIRILENV